MEDKTEDEIYCPECGKPIKRKAIVCPFCGIQVAKLATEEQPIIRVVPAVRAKSKAVAITLAVFFGYWSWLYMYKYNYVKFWIGFIVIAIGKINITVRALNLEPGELTSDNIWLIWVICSICIWLWALVDNIIKPDSFYENYGRL